MRSVGLRFTAYAAAPSPSVRVRTETLDRFLSSVGEVILTSRQARTAAHCEGLAPGASLGFDRIDRVVGELQRRALSLRTAPLLRVMEPLPRMVRDLSRQMGKRAEVELRGAELELDRSILDQHSSGITCLSGCLSGEINKMFLRDKREDAEPDVLGFRLGTLDTDPAAFVRFHLEEMKCEWCQANHDALALKGDLEPLLERVRASTARYLRSKTVRS